MWKNKKQNWIFVSSKNEYSQNDVQNWFSQLLEYPIELRLTDISIHMMSVYIWVDISCRIMPGALGYVSAMTEGCWSIFKSSPMHFAWVLGFSTRKKLVFHALYYDQTSGDWVICGLHWNSALDNVFVFSVLRTRNFYQSCSDSCHVLALFFISITIRSSGSNFFILFFFWRRLCY